MGSMVETTLVSYILYYSHTRGSLMNLDLDLDGLELRLQYSQCIYLGLLPTLFILPS